jgi:hypothetical protein
MVADILVLIKQISEKDGYHWQKNIFWSDNSQYNADFKYRKINSNCLDSR